MIYKKTEWEDVYRMWKAIDSPYLRGISKPITPERIPVISRYTGEPIYEIDWLDNETLKHEKESFKTIPFDLMMCFPETTPKGVKTTAKMLMYAQSEEEVAAIWIAAVCKTICLNGDIWSPLYCNALSLYDTAIRFLRRRFLVWHHATKRLVPDVNTQCKDYYDDKYKVQQEVMNFIFKNILELKKKYTIVEYSNVNEEETLINREKKNIHFYEDIS